ncbi:hypothetical protein MA16_Dca015643 [Dendrobium catenatum]|uniref:Uncharacterized protein n=1 Tax=Dendrobium catenatum TaxID=906689 RepID=A0A2I0VXK3_9ASPA|nr:hypothetical protein MA16_Dca015643 [Dendrobium catenatum]
MMDGEMDEAMRAHLPVSFGKQSMPQHRPSSVHLTTRSTLEPANNSSSSSAAIAKSSWVDESTKHSPTAVYFEEDAIGPLLPLPSVTGRLETVYDDDRALIGPPPPPHSSSKKFDEEEDDEEIIGPPRPPQLSSDDGSDSDLDASPREDKLRIPLSNEIVLKGHSRVCASIPIYFEFPYWLTYQAMLDGKLRACLATTRI